MSEETVKITSVTKTKDPKRVEAGKRLAVISREAKQKKANATLSRGVSNTPSSSTDLKEIGLMVSVVGILVGVVGLYYRFSLNKSEVECTNNSPDEHSVSKAHTDVHTIVEKSKTKLDTLD